MMGVNAFSEEVVTQAVPTNEQIALSRENLKTQWEAYNQKLIKPELRIKKY